MFFEKKKIDNGFELFIKICKTEKRNKGAISPLSIFDRFLALVFAEADLQNHMFCQALGSRTDFPVGLDPKILGERTNTY